MTVTFIRAGREFPVNLQSSEIRDAADFLSYLQEDYTLEIRVTLPEIRDEYSQEGGNE